MTKTYEEMIEKLGRELRWMWENPERTKDYHSYRLSGEASMLADIFGKDLDEVNEDICTAAKR